MLDIEHTEMKSIKIDGKTDGFGAQYLAKMSGFAYAQSSSDMCYQHQPFHEMEHLTTETVDDMNRFAGMTSDRQCKSTSPEVSLFREEVHWSEQPSKYYTPEVRSDLRRMYETSSEHKPRDHGCDIAFHVRRGDVDVSDTYRYTPNEEIRKHLDHLSSRFPSETICLLSEGKPEDFDVGYAEVTFKLNQDLRHTFDLMVSAPRLVVSNSTFPYSAAVLNTGHIMHYIKPRLGHRPLDHWENIDHE